MKEITKDNPFTKMQKAYYDTPEMAKEMASVDHSHHNKNKDYWDYLLRDIKLFPDDWEGKCALDVGCGTGRNIKNINSLARFKSIDGVDIGFWLIKEAKKRLSNAGIFKSKFFVSSGVDLKVLPNNKYDFVCSTIVFQHIPVYSIRNAMLRDIYKSMKVGGIFSCQFPFGKGYGKSAYTEDAIDAKETNTKHDFFMVESDIEILKRDLEEFGFKDFEYTIRKSFSDGHPKWLFFKVRK